MVLGAICFATTLAVSFSPVFTEWSVLVIVFILYGGGQAVWQGPTMALFGAYWPCNPQASYANLKLHSGFASAIGFFAFPQLKVADIAGACITTIAIGVVGYLASAVVTEG